MPEAPNTLRAPYTHWALAASVVWSLRNFIWINLSCFLCFLLTSTHGFRKGGEPSFVTLYGITNGSALLLWLLLVPRKHHAQEACKILFLRAFKQEARADVPNRVLPCIGCYGQLAWLRNTVKITHPSRVGPLSSENLTDSMSQPLLRDDWRRELHLLLVKADLVVIDFSVLSESVLWEIERCFEYMPAQRMILITELSRYAQDNYLTLCGRFPDLWNVPAPIPVYPSKFVIPPRFWSWWFFQYERRVYRCMRSIADQCPPVRRSVQAPEIEPARRE